MTAPLEEPVIETPGAGDATDKTFLDASRYRIVRGKQAEKGLFEAIVKLPGFGLRFQ